MHIPDGYLSPSTCLVTFAAAVPFWFIAGRKLEKRLHSEFLPLVALIAAFTFVVMMFNIPLPGGTSGHATGVGIAAIILGPWGAILALSLALFIQAVFFGDGGITSFGANAFNIAIIGSFTAYGVYSLLSFWVAITSRWRVWAAGIAGYMAVNAAAIFTAFEFGLQPLLFKDSTGLPLYAPYDMMIAFWGLMPGHLLIAGVAEGLVTAALFAYLQKTEPQLIDQGSTIREQKKLRHFSPTHNHLRLGLGLVALLLLTPLGLLATGTAWGEWGVEDFTNPLTRIEIMAASGGAALPQAPPEGFMQLSKLWIAPWPDYAPSFLRSEYFGYILSAMFGVGLIGLVVLGVYFILLWKSLRRPDTSV